MARDDEPMRMADIIQAINKTVKPVVRRRYSVYLLYWYKGQILTQILTRCSEMDAIIAILLEENKVFIDQDNDTLLRC